MLHLVTFFLRVVSDLYKHPHEVLTQGEGGGILIEEEKKRREGIRIRILSAIFAPFESIPSEFTGHALEGLTTERHWVRLRS